MTDSKNSTDGGRIWTDRGRNSTDGEESADPSANRRKRNGRIGAERALAAASESVPDVLYVIDAERTLIGWNDRLCEVTGYTDAELTDVRVLDLLPEADHEAFEAAVESMFETGRTETVETAIVTGSGQRIPYELNGTSVTNGADGNAVVVGTAREIANRSRDRSVVSRVLETSPVGIVTLDANREILWANARAEAVIGMNEKELVGMRYTDADWEAYNAEGDPLGPDERVITRAFETGEAGFDSECRFERPGAEPMWLSVSAAPVFVNNEIDRVVTTIEDVTERRERELELEAQRRELERLDRINAIIRRTNRALVGAVTREEIEGAVCERLTDAESYSFAWIGEPHPTNGEIDARAWAGREAGTVYLSDITITADDEVTASGPAGRAIRSRRVETSLIETDPAFAPWREAATEHGFRSTASVPLTYGDTLYGVLNLYTDYEEGFSEDEQEVLSELGEGIGYAINAIQSKRLLFTDGVTELEFYSDSAESFFIEASKAVGGTISLDGVVSSTAESDLYYVTLRDGDTEAVLSFAAETPGVEGRLVGERNGESRLEFRVSDSSITRSLLGQGAQVRVARAEDGESRVVAEVAPDADVRSVVETIRTAFPGSELVAKRGIERGAHTTMDFRERIEDALTERQAAALKAAFYTGYFEWPRTSSAEEVAETMDIASPTFHQHLRAAHRKMLEAFFER